MNQAIANILKGFIEDRSFVDKIAGLVSTQYMTIDGVEKSYPVACCVPDDCKVGSYNDLTPNSAHKTVIYFEDEGVNFVRAQGNFRHYQSRLRLVCWINVAKLNVSIHAPARGATIHIVFNCISAYYNTFSANVHFLGLIFSDFLHLFIFIIPLRQRTRLPGAFYDNLIFADSYYQRVILRIERVLCSDMLHFIFPITA